jgi:hypothetical protein
MMAVVKFVDELERLVVLAVVLIAIDERQKCFFMKRAGDS